MTKAMWGLLGVVLCAATAAAQPKPPEQTPAASPSPAPQNSGEKASSDESLQKGGDNRPWAAGISPERQKVALQLFRDGNAQLNDGLFARASETYRKALENFQKAIAFGDAPLQKDKLEHAKEYMLLLDKQIAHIEVSCDKPGAKVS